MKKIFLLFVVTAFALAACAEKPSISTPSRHPTAFSGQPTVTDPDKPIEVMAGTDFTIVVEANPSTGLHWEVAVELDTKVVEYVWKEFIAKGSAPGSSGWDVWTFKAVAPGKTIITLGDYRGYTEVASKLAEFTIVVK